MVDVAIDASCTSKLVFKKHWFIVLSLKATIVTKRPTLGMEYKGVALGNIKLGSKMGGWIG